MNDPCGEEFGRDYDDVDTARTSTLTSGGVELTDDLIDRLAAEAEAGYDVERLRPRRTDG